MNRANRRRKGVAKTSPTYNISQQQLKDMVSDEIEETKQKAISYTTSCLSAAFIIALHDQYGFGIKRLENVLDKVKLQFECIDAGTVTVEDLVAWCLDYGIKVD